MEVFTDMKCRDKYKPIPQVHDYELDDLTRMVTTSVEPLETDTEKDIDVVAREIVEAENLYYGKNISTEEFIANVKKALLLYLPKTLTVDYLIILHQVACTGVDDDAGTLRQGIGMTMTHVFPGPEKMTVLLDKLVDEYNKSEDTENKFRASMFVMKFLGIHPFEYANGITARILFSKLSGTLSSLSGNFKEYVEPLVKQDPIAFCRYCWGYRKPAEVEPQRYLVRDIDWENDSDLYRLVKNSIKCLKCGDVIEKNYDDLLWCTCESSGVDGGLNYLRRLFTEDYGFEELSECVKK